MFDGHESTSAPKIHFIEKVTKPARLLIVVATYNEILDLPTLVDELLGHLPNATILIIDDNSPDGTGHWSLEKSRGDPRIETRIRPFKQGLGSAAITGLEHGISNGFDLIATMDSDLSHDPGQLPDLIKNLPTAGTVIGSRYVAGGQIIGWPLSRKLASRFINGFARTWLGLRPRDNSSAFRVYDTKALRQIDLKKIRSSGFGYLEEIIYRMQRAGVSIVEVPITFRNRTHGKSKTNWRVGIGAIWRILVMRFTG